MKKINKLNILKESMRRERKCALPIGFAVISQERDVIQDKINEIIEAINVIGKSFG